MPEERYKFTLTRLSILEWRVKMSAGFMAIRARAIIAAILCGLITLSAHGAKAADAYRKACALKDQQSCDALRRVQP